MNVPDRTGQVWDFDDNGLYLIVYPPTPHQRDDDYLGAPRFTHTCLRLDAAASDGIWRILEEAGTSLESGDGRRID